MSRLGRDPVFTRRSGPDSAVPYVTCVGVLAANNGSKTDRALERTQNKDIASSAQHASCQAGPEASQAHGAPMFQTKTHTHRFVKLGNFKIVWRSELQKWPLAQTTNHISANSFCFQTCESRRHSKILIFLSSGLEMDDTLARPGNLRIRESCAHKKHSFENDNRCFNNSDTLYF